MAISWLTVLRAVPWGDVIENAPRVVEGAKRLWKTALKTTAQEAPHPPKGSETETDPIAALEAQVETLETAVVELKKEMRESAELIKALADQNAQLIQRVEETRVRMLWLSAATAASVVVALISLGFALSKHL